MATVPELGLEELVRVHQRGVWRYLRFLGAGPAEADDLTQETFIEIWRRPFEQRDERATAAYLRQVARNRFLMFLRARRRRPEVDMETADQDFMDYTGDDGGDLRVQVLSDCLSKLEGRARAALDLCYARQVERAEAARQLSLSEEGLKTLLRRVKHALRECVARKIPQARLP
ncbi:MAG: RNA polymerase sigma factor [Planctomycetes bacterium]|nr:RNA polymerase sigma factor [Planctomycetota bacterium]